MVAVDCFIILSESNLSGVFVIMIFLSLNFVWQNVELIYIYNFVLFGVIHT